MAQLERAMEQVNLKVEHTRLLVITHAHVDHWGQAAPVLERAGCQMWMHPNHDHATRPEADPAAALARRLEVGRQSGIPEAVLQRFAEHARDRPSGIARAIEPDRELVPGVSIETDLGTWSVIETPGHAPSHVCLYQAERRLLISGDHVLGRPSLYYDYGWTPDPVGEFLTSLDAVDRLDARLGLSGHGKPFVDVPGHVVATRGLVVERLAAVAAAVADDDAPLTAAEIAPRVFGAALSEANAPWWLSETLCYLQHLELEGRVARAGDGSERWRSTQP
jgi:glyoxylase-like metal-dependent hydrolase (beta-lactamase superfamily II)